MERTRPPPLSPEVVKKLVIERFSISAVDVSTIRELDSYEDRNYLFQGTLAATGNDTLVASEYVFKVLNWRDSLSPRLTEGMNEMMLHLRNKGYRCSYPIPAAVTGERDMYSVVLTEEQLDAFVSLDQTRLDVQCKTDVNYSKQNGKKFDVRVLVYVEGQPMGKMKTPPSERLLYATGQYVGGMDLALQVSQTLHVVFIFDYQR